MCFIKNRKIKRSFPNRYRSSKQLLDEQVGLEEANRLVKYAELPRIRFHDLRHTAATIMLGHGIPPMIVAGMLGHSIPVLLNTYTHFIPTMQDQAAQLVDDILTPIPVDS
jgi:integrase